MHRFYSLQTGEARTFVIAASDVKHCTCLPWLFLAHCVRGSKIELDPDMTSAHAQCNLSKCTAKVVSLEPSRTYVYKGSGVLSDIFDLGRSHSQI